MQPTPSENLPIAVPGGRPRRLRLVIAVTAWGYLVLVLGCWGLLRATDLWWPATLLAFSPRWPLAFPLLLLLPAAAFWQRRSLWPLLLALVLLLGPVMGLRVPLGRGAVPDGLPLRVLTCNMHYGKPDPRRLDQLLAETTPDVIALQEWNGRPETLGALSGSRWHLVREEGLFLASRHPIRRHGRIGTEVLGKHGSTGWYELETPAGIVTLFSVHLASPREGLQEVRQGQGRGGEGLRAGSELRRLQTGALARAADKVEGPVLLVGDFNTPPESVLFREELGRYTNAFTEAGWGWGWTFRSRWVAVRIDHVLMSPGWRAERCWVGPDVGSPHRPVLADVAWDGVGYGGP